MQGSAWRQWAIGLLLGSLSAAAPGATWTVDQAHSSVLFFVPHFDLARSIGRFNQIDGEFDIDARDPGNSSAQVRIATRSLDMGDQVFTDTMLGSDWFDAEQFPQLHFVSGKVTALADDQWQIDGELRIRDQTGPVSLVLERYRCATPPLTGRYSCGYSLSGEVNHHAFGLDRHRRFVGATVELRIELELQRENPRAGRKHKR